MRSLFERCAGCLARVMCVSTQVYAAVFEMQAAVAEEGDQHQSYVTPNHTVVNLLNT